MARKKNTRATSIYWLVDSRTGTPFYCGKTVLTPAHRFASHKRESANGGDRPLHHKIRECGEHVTLHIMETVPASGNWAERERRWILLLRHTNPNACNLSDGGDGAPGLIISPETRAKLSASLKGKIRTPEHCANLSASKKGKKRKPRTDETRAKLSAIAKNRSPETRAKYSESNRNRVVSPETRTRMSVAAKAYYARRAFPPCPVPAP